MLIHACKIAICLFLTLCCLSPAYAAKTIYIYVEINEYGSSGQEALLVPELYTAVRDILVSEGFDPIFIAAVSDEDYPDFFEPFEKYEDIPNFWKQALSLSPNPNAEKGLLMVTQYAGYEFPGLPMGTYGMATMPRISADRPESVQEVARLAAGIALYTVNRCDIALPYLVEANTNEALMDNGVMVYTGTMFYRANCEVDQGLFEDAAASYQAVLEYPYKEWDNFDVLIFSESAAINLAWLDVKLGKQAEAIALLDSYRAADYGAYRPREIERFLERADLYLAVGENDAAIAEVTSLIEIGTASNQENPNVFTADVLARLYTERGQRYMKIDQPVQALADFEQAVQIDDQYPKVYFWRGMLYNERGELTQARADFEQFLTLAPGYFHHYEEDLTPYMAQAKNMLLSISSST